MKYILLSLLSINCAYAQFDYDHLPLNELKKIDAEVYHDDKFGLFIKYQDHWYQVLNTDHHVLCPCYYHVQYHNDLCQELSGY